MAGFSPHRQGSETIHILVFDLDLGSNHELVPSESHDRVDRRRTLQWRTRHPFRVDLHGHTLWHFECDLCRHPTLREENPRRRTSRAIRRA